MIDMCSCFECLQAGNSSDSRDILDQPSMTGHSRWLSSPLTIRTGRPFVRGLCLLALIFTFSVGLGIGVLISIYLLPINSESPLIRRTYESPYSKSESPQFRTQFEVNVPLTTAAPSPSDSIPESISSRFPEFGQIEALVKSETKGSSQNPILQRPIPNVEFIPMANRILALHPDPQKVESRPGRPGLAKFVEMENESRKLLPTKSSNLLDGIYWSDQVEAQVPHGFTPTQLERWRTWVHDSAILKMEEGCGRMQNRLLTLANETRACCRYRQNSDQIQGEIFSFYLSQLLGIRNVAPSALSLIQISAPKWKPVKSQIRIAKWADEKPVVLTQFLPNLSPANIPALFRDSKRGLHPADVLSFAGNMDLSELAQWSDLIVFDYLTANLDRIVNNLYNLQWNPSMMDAPAHNLVRDTETGLLIFLDNESGLLHGYRLLDKYEHYHRLMLDSLCIFRRSTGEAIRKLYQEKNVGDRMKEMFHELEPILVDYLPMLPEKSVKILNRRIKVVHDRILKCESLNIS